MVKDAVSHDYDIIVVGAGPTGLAAANLLGRYGVRTLLIERNVATVQEPRAVSIDDESLRTVQACGAIESVKQQIVAGYGSEYYGPSGKMFLKVRPVDAPYGFPRRNAFRQPVFEAQLRANLERFDRVDTAFGVCVAGLAQDDHGVRLSLTGKDGLASSVLGRFVIAADGASSPLRSMLGLTLDGETFSEKWLIVDLEQSAAPSWETIVFCDIRRPCIALPGPNMTRRFEFKLVPSDDLARMTDDDIVTGLLDSHGVAPESRISRKAIYTFHARLASRWRSGRVFLAGDACHLTPPFAGQGMNSGIRDAHNLAWKLAWIVQNGFPESILDSYEQERRDHVKEMIDLALRMGRIMGPESRLSGWLIRTAFHCLSAWPAAREYFAQMKYKPKPRFAKGLLVADGRPSRKTAVGRLLPQPIVDHAGQKMLLDDLLGPGFSIISFVPSEQLAAVRTHPAFFILNPMLVIVASNGVRMSDAEGGIVVYDGHGHMAKGMDRTEGRIFVVRPDRYVMAAFTPQEAEGVMGRILALLDLVK